MGGREEGCRCCAAGGGESSGCAVSNKCSVIECLECLVIVEVGENSGCSLRFLATTLC